VDIMLSQHLVNLFFLLSIIGRPFVKRFALRYQTVVCPVLLVMSVSL